MVVKIKLADDYNTVAVIDFDTESVERTLDVAYTWSQNDCDSNGWIYSARQYENNYTFVDYARSTKEGDIFEIEGINYKIIENGFLQL
jgi:hypothetical protein